MAVPQRIAAISVNGTTLAYAGYGVTDVKRWVGGGAAGDYDVTLAANIAEAESSAFASISDVLAAIVWTVGTKRTAANHVRVTTQQVNGGVVALANENFSLLVERTSAF